MGTPRTILRLAVAAVTLFACVDAQTQPCGERTCGPGTVCVDASASLCAQPAAIEACTGKADTEACSFNPLGAGVCDRGRCIEAGCGNGLVEPAAGEVCDDGNRLHADGCSADCMSTEACGNGFTDSVLGEVCDDRNAVSGDGCSADCKMLEFCGDGVLHAGEICDDGNLVSGDGCSVDCRSLETCGNGYIDFIKGEVCDDANQLRHDGCDSCQFEQWRWRLAAGPNTVVFGGAVATDPTRGHVLFLVPSGLQEGNWLWSGAAWEHQDLPGAGIVPPAVDQIVYDATRDRYVVYGFNDYDTQRDETWEFNPTTQTWTVADPGLLTRAAFKTALGHHVRSGKTIAFGGISVDPQDPPNLHLDTTTWSWNGTSWQELTVQARPPERKNAAMAYDPKIDRLVLFGGSEDLDELADDDLLGDTWVFTGTTWQAKSPPTPLPPPRADHAMTYDDNRGGVLMHGGRGGAGYLSDLWLFDGDEWTEISGVAQQVPPPLAGHSLVFDPIRKVVILAGGYSSSGPNTETWEFDAAGWARVVPATLPTPTDSPSLVYDERRATSVRYSGDPTNRETWLWNGRWRLSRNVTTMPGRRDHDTAYDAARDRVVLFGGVRQCGLGCTVEADDTWEWNGATWLDRGALTPRPLARHRHAMAYDRARQETVVFGGCRGSLACETGTALDDTWVWTGVAWQLRTPAQHPPARYGHRMIYDRQYGRVIVTGGYAMNQVALDDTWEWNGLDWAEVITPTSPVARAGQGFAFDPVRGMATMFGGFFGSGTFLGDAYVLDRQAQEWQQIFPAPGNSAPKLSQVRMIWDASRGEALIHARGTTTYLQGLASDGRIPDECQRGLDRDGDGLSGCADPDCWGYCTPLCAPSEQPCVLPLGPRCGNGMCDKLETYAACPADCALVTTCGDLKCEAPESALTCPGDCP